MEPSAWMGLAGDTSEIQKLQFPLTKNRERNTQETCVIINSFFCAGKLQFLDSGHVFSGGSIQELGSTCFFLGGDLLSVFLNFPFGPIWIIFLSLFTLELSFLGGASYGFCWDPVWLVREILWKLESPKVCLWSFYVVSYFVIFSHKNQGSALGGWCGHQAIRSTCLRWWMSKSSSQMWILLSLHVGDMQQKLNWKDIERHRFSGVLDVVFYRSFTYVRLLYSGMRATTTMTHHHHNCYCHRPATTTLMPKCKGALWGVIDIVIAIMNHWSPILWGHIVVVCANACDWGSSKKLLWFGQHHPASPWQ